MSVDYRGEAETYARYARELWRTDSAEAAQAAAVSTAHSALAAAKPPTPVRRPQDDAGLRDLLSAARGVIAHAAFNLREDVVVLRPGDYQALVQQVDEATEAGL